MRKLLVLALALCLSLVVAGPAAAWEFGLTGKMNWDYRGITQLGNEGFFGPWNVDLGFTNGGAANAGVSATNQNLWAGYLTMDPQSLRDLASTHSALWNTYWMDFEPEIRLNPAIRIRSTMRIGAWRVPENFTGIGTTNWRNNPMLSNTIARWGNSRQGSLEAKTTAVNQTPSLFNGSIDLNAAGNVTKLNPPWTEQVSGFWLANTIQSQQVVNWLGGTQVSISPIYVNNLWVTAQTPWGIMVFGKRPSPFGMGLIFDGYESSSESLLLVAPYGPFRIGISYNPWNQGDPLSMLYGDWYNPYDAGNARLISVAPFFTYENGPLSMGAILAYNFRHRDAGGVLPNNGTAAPTARRDNVDYILSMFLKYNNGHFFFNGEIATYNRARYQQGNMPPYGAFAGFPNPNAPGEVTAFPSGFSQAPWYIEDWRYGFETGCVLGPAKVSILGAWLSGPDRRAGVFIDRLPMQFGNGTVLGNGSVFEPYSPIFVRNYGSGAGAYNVPTRKGTGVDFRALAMRVDYAVAANLNTYFSAWYAERNGTGYGWGWIAPQFNWAGPNNPPTQPTGRTNTTNVWAQPVVAAIIGPSPFNWSLTGPAPTIPSADLGWELGAGWNWQLLEGLECTGDFGVWWPGSWFSYACVSRANPVWGDQSLHSDLNQWGTAPARLIDPVFQWSLKLITAF